MKNRNKIKDLLSEKNIGSTVVVMGWVRTFRSNRFISINDGSGAGNLQAVVEFEKMDPEILKHINTGSCLKLKGVLEESPGSGQAVELRVNEIEILGGADPEVYPLQPKKHSLEFLREIAHLRVRTNTFGAIYRIRHAMIFAVHQFFHDRGFLNVHTPIITGSDAEGAGEMFRVTTLPSLNPPLNEKGDLDFSEDFFGKETNLTVSGQLEGETAALALAEIYTFGPTFRAENSNTTRHLAEFWMIEPEMAFYDISDNMDLAEEFVRYLIRYALENCGEDLEILKNRLLEEEKSKPADQRSPWDLIEKLKFVAENNFERITYTEAIEILKKSKPNQKKKFQYPVNEWGIDIQTEHERFLVEKHFMKPVIIYNYPKAVKAFYMRDNGDNTVAAMDVLFPGIGEIIGGSQREERLEVLLERMREMHVPEKDLWWYLELRKFGSAPHSGFGLGFERFIQFVCGMNNIRDVIPFPRFPKNAEF